MALGTIAASLAASAASGAAQYGISKLFGSKGSSTDALPNFQPTGFFAGGLNASGTGTVTPTAERMNAVSNLAALFPEQAKQIADLRSRFAPGVSDLRASRIADLETMRQRITGDLRDNMARRRVLGSSFAEDYRTRAELEFARERDRINAESTLQEVEGTLGLIQQEHNARAGEFKTKLDEMNLEANLAAGLAGKATDAMAGNARIAAQLAFKENEGMGSLIGKLSQPFADALGKGVGAGVKPFFGGA